MASGSHLEVAREDRQPARNLKVPTGWDRCSTALRFAATSLGFPNLVAALVICAGPGPSRLETADPSQPHTRR